LINAYPYFAYKGNPKQVSLDFVLFQQNQGIVDPSTNLHYDNMLFAQIDAVYAALAALGYKKLPVQISETGWPSKGDADEAGATPENAKKYNGNLMKLMNQKKGTPMRPSSDLNIYVFALFNENMKPGPTSERNYGLFKPDGTPVYSLGITNVAASNTTTNFGGSSGIGGTETPASSSTGYLTISSATVSFVLFTMDKLHNTHTPRCFRMVYFLIKCSPKLVYIGVKFVRNNCFDLSLTNYLLRSKLR
jgi:hypothetical protein